MSKIHITIIEPCDFIAKPVGGQLSFCKQLAESYADECTLIGVSVAADPTGTWLKKIINNKSYLFFNLYTLSNRSKPVIPLRILNFFSVLRFRNEILKDFSSYFLIHSPEVIIALTIFKKNKNNLFYFFHGTENPLLRPRYKWGIIFARLFEWLHFRSLQDVRNIFVCADEIAIEQLKKRLFEFKIAQKITQFPTRFDDNSFFPETSSSASKPRCESILKKMVVTGRINHVKGWLFLLEVFKALCTSYPEFQYQIFFVGDGEDKKALKLKAAAFGFSESVFVTGFVDKDTVRDYLCKANLYLIGSLNEGWSVAMLEALACGKNIVSTDVSGASNFIKNGLNGFVCKTRDSQLFADYVFRALTELPFLNKYSIEVASHYKASGLRKAFDSALNISI